MSFSCFRSSKAKQLHGEAVFFFSPASSHLQAFTRCCSKTSFKRNPHDRGHVDELSGLQGTEACPSAGSATGALVWLGGWIAATGPGWVGGGGGCSYVIMFMC